MTSKSKENIPYSVLNLLQAQHGAKNINGHEDIWLMSKNKDKIT